MDRAGDGTPRVATYRLAGPGGSWELDDNGTYTVSVEPNQVADVAIDFVAAGPLGTFRAVLPKVFTVTSAADSGPGSRRDVLAQTNAQPSEAPDLIVFDPAVFGAPRLITLTSGPLAVTDSVTVQGPGAGLLTVSGGNASTLFRLNGPGRLTVALAGMTLTGGRTAPDQSGGAVYSQGEDLLVSGCVLSGNTAGSGGAIFCPEGDGTLTVRDSRVVNNAASASGGGIAWLGARAVIEASSVDANTAANGGGVVVTGALTLLHSTVACNRATGPEGGGIFLPMTGSVLIQNSTVSGNSSTTRGGGLSIGGWIPGSQALIQNSTVTANATATSAGGGSLRPRR